MKKSIYISGISCAILMLMGCLFKVMHWPGAGVMLVMAVTLFCLYFLPMALMNSYKEGENKSKTLHITTYFVFFICMSGVLFKIMHWPGAAYFLFPGILLPFVVFFPVYLYQTREESKIANKNFLGIVFGLIFLAVFGVMLALSVSRQILERAGTQISNNERTQAFYAPSANYSLEDEKVVKASRELCFYIDELKCELLNATGEEICNGKNLKPGFEPGEMNDKDNREIPKHLLFENGAKNKIEVLKTKMTTLRDALLASKKITPELAELTNSLFDVNSQKANEYGDVLSWEDQELKGYSLVFVVDALSLIQSNAKLTERELASL
jgi:hypothetical protein